MILDQRHLGRIVRELLTPRVADIDVLRVAITVQLPQARYGHRAPCSVVVVRAEEIRRTLVSVTCPAESPYAVERKEAPGSVFITDGSRCNGFICELGGTHRQAVYGIDVGILPFGKGLGGGHRQKSDAQQRKK